MEYVIRMSLSRCAQPQNKLLSEVISRQINSGEAGGHIKEKEHFYCIQCYTALEKRVVSFNHKAICIKKLRTEEGD